MEKIEISLEDLLELTQMLEDLNEFFHNEAHYKDVHAFGARIYPQIRKFYYHTTWEWLPEEEKKRILDL
jgi:hypothetical protein